MALVTLAWLLPILALPVCLFLTRDLRTIAAPEAVDGAKRSGPAPIVGVVLYVVVGLVCIFVPELTPVAIVLGMVALVLHLRALSARRLASRSQVAVGVFLLAILYWGGPLGFALRDHDRTASAWINIATAVLAALALFREQRSGELTDAGHRRSRVLTVVMCGIAAFGLVRVATAGEYGNRDQLLDFVAAFDDPATEIGDWEQMGEVAAALWRAGHRPDTSRAAATIHVALREGVDVHPSTLLGAHAAGLLGPDDWASYRAHEISYQRDRLLARPGTGYILTLSKPLDIRALMADPSFTPEEAEIVAGKLARSWPRERGVGRLEDALRVADLLVELRRRDLVEAAREPLHALLRRSWCKEPSYGAPYGFTGYDDERDGCGPSDDATLYAVLLMRYVGVPEGIDLRRVAWHLERELERPRLLGTPQFSSLDAETATALLILQDEHADDLILRFDPERHIPLLGALAPLLFGVVLLLRRPRVVEAPENEDDQAEEV